MRAHTTCHPPSGRVWKPGNSPKSPESVAMLIISTRVISRLWMILGVSYFQTFRQSYFPTKPSWCTLTVQVPRSCASPLQTARWGSVVPGYGSGDHGALVDFCGNHPFFVFGQLEPSLKVPWNWSIFENVWYPPWKLMNTDERGIVHHAFVLHAVAACTRLL